MTAKPVPRIDAINRAYFEGTAQHELRIARCTRCETRFRFAHALCPRCWSAELTWDTATGRGAVSAFSVVHQPPSPAFSPPYVLALIQLDEGVTMMSNVIDCDPAAVHVGMPVVVTFEPRGEAVLPMFRPADAVG